MVQCRHHKNGRSDLPQYSIILSLDGVGKTHINIRWSDDGSDENERIYRYRPDCGLIVSARKTPQPSGDPRVHVLFSKKNGLSMGCALTITLKPRQERSEVTSR